jgi:hypothetical protein
LHNSQQDFSEEEDSRSYFRAFNRMPFSRYVEIGRVALINYGEEYGKLVVISDVVDQNRVRFLLISGQL